MLFLVNQLSAQTPFEIYCKCLSVKLFFSACIENCLVRTLLSNWRWMTTILLIWRKNKFNSGNGNYRYIISNLKLFLNRFHDKFHHSPFFSRSSQITLQITASTTRIFKTSKYLSIDMFWWHTSFNFWRFGITSSSSYINSAAISWKLSNGRQRTTFWITKIWFGQILGQSNVCWIHSWICQR